MCVYRNEHTHVCAYIYEIGQRSHKYEVCIKLLRTFGLQPVELE